MEDLELLKQHWNKPTVDFKSYTEHDLFKMIKGKSANIARMLLIIGLLEICFWTFFNYLDISKNESFFGAEYILRTLLFVIFIGMLIYSFTRIKNENNSKKLMHQIINLRKVILAYIILTFILILIFGILNVDKNANGAFNGFVTGWNTADKDYPLDKSTPISISPKFGYLFYFLSFSTGLIILYFLYKRIYGKLLEKLIVNYKELSKIEKN